MKSPAWTEDELVLAGALVVKNGWHELRTGDREVQELSELLRHVTPLHTSGTRKTKLKDLACVCANCHRMCHRSRPGESWRTPDALREEIRKSGQNGAH